MRKDFEPKYYLRLQAWINDFNISAIRFKEEIDKVVSFERFDASLYTIVLKWIECE